MELKHTNRVYNCIPNHPLIEPYGIETQINGGEKPDCILPLIEPYGIETRRGV